MTNAPVCGAAPKRVVHQSGFQHLIGRQQVRHFPHIFAGWAVHASAARMKSRRIGQNRSFHRQLGRVRKRRHFSRILIILLGKSALSVRIAIVVDHALDVAGGHRAKSTGSEVTKQSHRHTWLIAIGMRNHHSRLVGFGLDDRTEQ